MDRLTLNDLTNEDAYTYAEMLRKYKDKINEIIRYVNNINPAYQHSVEMRYEGDEAFTLCFTFKNDDKNKYNTLDKLISRFANDGVRFTASGKIQIDGNVHNIDYIIVDDTELGIGFVENDSVGYASSYYTFDYTDIDNQDLHINDNVYII